MITYEVQTSESKVAIWVHASDGSTVGRFGKMGIDIHNTVTEQLAGKPECRLCTHGHVSETEWTLFREKALEFWGVNIPKDAIDPKILKSSEEQRRDMVEKLFDQLSKADINYTDENGITELSDWDEMLECEVKHFNINNDTQFEPKEMRIQYIEKQESKLGY